MELYILLGVIIFGMNVIPAFMPPTWIVLAFFHLHYKMELIPIVVIGAVCATMGRIALALLARSHFRRFISKESQKNLDALGQFVNTHMHISIPLFITYAFFPIPSNHVYITAGLANARLSILALSFLGGRLISYTFWVSTAHVLAKSVQTIFGSSLSSWQSIAVDVAGFILIFLISKINWMKVLPIKKTKKR